MKLEGRVAIVTGGGRAIGRMIALRLAQEGADLVVASPDEADLHAVAVEVQALGRQALPIVMDVTHEAQVQAMAEQVRQHFGRIDVLVNNAGITGPTAPVPRVDRADWDEVLAVNLTGPFLCCKAVLPSMIDRRQGKVINIASIVGKIGYALRSPYAVSKWGLIGLTLTLAKEVGEHNIQVNAVCPGPVQGERMQRLFEQRARELQQSVAEVERDYVKTTLLKRLIPADHVAAMVAYLASAEADTITGQAIDVSAGYGL
jgi:NAD(P)-dependent dehydrogenase (short-subunit alcohol dehydrogenase family)